MAKKNPDEGKLYRLRNPETGLYLTMIRSGKGPQFNKRGKDYKTYADLTYTLMHYNMEAVGQKWPKLDIVTFQMMEGSVEPDPTRDMRHVKKFTTKAFKNNEWSSPARFVMKLAAAGTEFRYLVHAFGSHPMTALTPVALTRNSQTQHYFQSPMANVRHHRQYLEKGETIIALGDSETDLMYIKLHLNDCLFGIWDYKTGKKIS